MRFAFLLALILPPLPGRSEANPIDRYFEGYWSRRRIAAPRRADDYEFLRRVRMDITGRLPRPDEIRAFAADRAADKRSRTIEDLLRSAEAARFWADQWMRILFHYRFEETDPFRIHFPAFADWLQETFRKNMPYDEFARRLIGDRGDYIKKPATNYILKHLDPRRPPVELTSRMTRVFLGIDLQCAQCHDHPTRPWTQKDFWGLAAFFSGLRAKPRKTFEGFSVKLWDRGAREIRIPDTETRISPRFLDGKVPPDFSRAGDALARFFIEYKNDRFAETFVSRMWRHFLGGSLEGHPDLVRALTRAFKADGYRIRNFLRVLLNSRVYQARCETGPAAPDTGHTRMAMKPQNPVQLLNTLSYALELDTFLNQFYEQYVKNPNLPPTYRNREVFRVFLHRHIQKLLATGDRAPEESGYAGSLRLALHMMNSDDLQGLVRAHWGRLKAIMRLRTPDERIEEIFLTLLSRPPRGTERVRYRNYIHRKGGSPRAYEDVYWVLMNSSEFFFLH